MAVFPFTVRATDSEGSYADRQFNITVKNSRVERYMVLGSTDAWTSPDCTTWTQRLGQGGHSCTYGNGFWLIIQWGTFANGNSNYGFQVKKSTDGINYNFIGNSSLVFQDATGTVISGATYPYLFCNSTSPTTGPAFNNSTFTNVTGSTVSATPRVKFWNGKFWLVAPGNRSSTVNTVNNFQNLILWSSVDGITWTEKILLTASQSTQGLSSSLTSGVYNYSDSDGAFFITNPVYSGSVIGTSPFGWMTTDGVTFTAIKNGASAATTAQYSAMLTRINGLYFTIYASPVGGGATPVAGSSYQYSTDGINWTIGTFSGNSNGPQQIFYMNGSLYSFQQAGGSNAGIVITSVDGLTWTSISFQTFSTGNGYTPLSVAKNGIILMAASPGSTAVAITGSQSTLTAGTGIRYSVDGATFASVALPNSPLFIYDVAAM